VVARTSPYPLRSRLSDSARDGPSNGRGENGTPQSSQALKIVVKKKRVSGACTPRLSEQKMYNLARAEPSPARHAGHAVYTGVLASSLEPRDLLDKQQQQLSTHDRREAPNEGTDARQPSTEAAGAVHGAMLRRRRYSGGAERGQLALLARALVNPADAKAGRVGSPGSAQQQLHSMLGPDDRGSIGIQVAENGGPTWRDGAGAPYAAAINEGDDVSMAELNECLATGSAKIQAELPTAGANAGAPLPASGTPAASWKLGGSSSRLASRAASASTLRTPGGRCGGAGSNQQQRRLLRCNSPMDLCQAVQSAQARAEVHAGCDVRKEQHGPAVGAGAAGSLSEPVATPTQETTSAAAMRRCLHTRVRLQRSEPSSGKDGKALPKSRAGSEKEKGTAELTADGKEPYSSSGDGMSLTDGCMAASGKERSRAVSRLNPARPLDSQPQPGDLAPRCQNTRAADVSAAGSAEGAVVPLRTETNGSGSGVAQRASVALFEPVVSEPPTKVAMGVAAMAVAKLAAAQPDLQSPTPSLTGIDPWITVAKLAARAASVTCDVRPQQQPEQPGENGGQEAKETGTSGADVVVSAHVDIFSGGTGSGRAAEQREGGGEAPAAAAITVQLSTGDEEDTRELLFEGSEEEQQLATTGPGTARPNATRERTKLEGSLPGRHARNLTRRGRGKVRGRGRRSLSSVCAAETVTTSGRMNRGKAEVAATAKGADCITPGALRAAFRADSASGDDSSPDVPIGKLVEAAAAAAAAGAADAAVVTRRLCPPSSGGLKKVVPASAAVTAVTPVASKRATRDASAALDAGNNLAARISVFADSPSAVPDSEDLPIGQLVAAAAAAAAAAGTGTTRSPGSSPSAGAHGSREGGVDNAGEGAPGADPIPIVKCAGALQQGQRRGQSKVSDNASGVAPTPAAEVAAATAAVTSVSVGGNTTATKHEARRKRKRRSSTSLGLSSGGSAELHPADRAARGAAEGLPRGGTDGAPGSDIAAVSSVPIASEPCQGCSTDHLGLAAGIKQGSQQPVTTAAASSADAGTEEARGVATSGQELASTVASQQPQLASAVAGGSKVQLANLWKRQRVMGSMPQSVTRVGGARPGSGRMEAKLRPQAGAACEGATHTLRADVQQQELQEPQSELGHAGHGAQGPRSEHPCQSAVAPAAGKGSAVQQEKNGGDGVEQNVGCEAAHGETVGKPQYADVEMVEPVYETESYSCGVKEQEQQRLCLSELLPSEASAGRNQGVDTVQGVIVSASSGNSADPEDGGSDRTAGYEDGACAQPAAAVAAVNRVHIRSVWKRPRLAEASRPVSSAGGGRLTGRRALLGSSLQRPAGATAAPVQASTAAALPGRVQAGPEDDTGPAVLADQPSAVADGECEVRLQQQAQQPKAAADSDSAGGDGSQDGNGGHHRFSGNVGLTPVEEGKRDADQKNRTGPLAVSAVAVAAGLTTAMATSAINVRGDALHHTPPRMLRGGPLVTAPSPRISALGVIGKPPRSPCDLRAAATAVPPSPRLLPSPSPSSCEVACRAGHRLRDPSLHPAALPGGAGMSPIQPLLSRLQAAAVPSPLAHAGTGSRLRPPPVPMSPLSGSTAAAAAILAAADAPLAPSPAPDARAPSPLALLSNASKRMVASAAEASFLQPLAPIRTKALQPAAATGGAASGVKRSVVQAVEALLSIPLLGNDDDSSPSGTGDADAAVAASAAITVVGAEADDTVRDGTAPTTGAAASDGAMSPGGMACRLERLLDAASCEARGPSSVAAEVHGSENQHAAGPPSAFALLVDVAAAQSGGEDAKANGKHGAKETPCGSCTASASGGACKQAGSSDPLSEGPKPLRSALRGVQPFFSAPGLWAAGHIARSPPQMVLHGGAAVVAAAATTGPNGGGGAVCSLVCEERLDLFHGKAASPLPPRPRPSSKQPKAPPTDSRSVPGITRHGLVFQPCMARSPTSRLSPSKATTLVIGGQAESPVAGSLRPTDGFSTPPCGTSKSRHGGATGSASGWHRAGDGVSSLYPGHQYDSMIEDVVQQILNEASPELPPSLELTLAAAPMTTSVAAAGGVTREGVTGVVARHAPAMLASGDENEPQAVNGVAPSLVAAAPPATGVLSLQHQLQQQTPPLPRSTSLTGPAGKRRRSGDVEDFGGADAGGEEGTTTAALGEAEQRPEAQAQPVGLVGHRRRPRKAARVDGGPSSVAAAAAAAAVAAVAVNDKQTLDELSNLDSDDSDDDVLDCYSRGGAASSGAGGGPGRGVAGQARTQGAQRGVGGGPGRGPGFMFAGRLLPYGPPCGGNWMKPGLAWSRTAGGAPPPVQPFMGPARPSPQLRAGGPSAATAAGASRPSPPVAPLGSGAGGARLATAATPPPPPSMPACLDNPALPGEGLLDVPRTLSMPRSTVPSRRQNTYLSAAADASSARPTLEQEYREALINLRLAQAWAAGERWARCDLAGLPADVSKRGVTERLAVLDIASSKLNCYRGAEGATKVMAKVEEEWEHLRRIRMAAASRSTVRTPSGTTPSPAPGGHHSLRGGASYARVPHTPLPFAAHAHAAAAALAAAVPAPAPAGPHSLAAAGTQQGGPEDMTVPAAATPPSEPAAVAAVAPLALGHSHAMQGEKTKAAPQQDDQQRQHRHNSHASPLTHPNHRNVAGCGGGFDRPFAATPPPAAAGTGLFGSDGVAGGNGGDASALLMHRLNPQQLQLTPPASILKTVPTPYTAPVLTASTPSGATGGKKAVKFAAVLELGPQSGYRHTKRPAPPPRPSFDLTIQSQSELQPQEEQEQGQPSKLEQQQ
ncbi:hypothetical protein VOLCADRAFT_94443, partial [Volvox carteri f. nagariensis]